MTRRRKLVALSILVLVILTAAGTALYFDHYTKLASHPPQLQIVHEGTSGKLVIFVHGLCDGPDTAFSGGSLSWPALIGIDQRSKGNIPALSTYSTALLSYPASGADRLSVPQIAARLLDKIAQQRILERYSEIFFVAHSLGGLVVMQMVLSDAGQLADRTRAIFFIATPSQGARLAVYAKSMPLFGCYSSSRLATDLATLDENSWLQDLRSRWDPLFLRRHTERTLKIYCAHETGKWKGLVIVPQHDSYMLCSENTAPFTTNHSSIVKPTSITDDIYEWARFRLLSGAVKQTGGTTTSTENEQLPLVAPCDGLQISVGVDIRCFKPGRGKTEWFKDCPKCPEMVVIPAGQFVMGSEIGNAFERPHNLVVDRPFAISRFEITVGELETFAQATGHTFSGDCSVFVEGAWQFRATTFREPGHPASARHPAVCVTWDDAAAFVAWISSVTKKRYRLVREYEWEYSARAGSVTHFSWGNEIGTSRANCGACGSSWDKKEAAPVGSFEPNEFGVYDMHGNASEWVADCWAGAYKPGSTNAHPTVEASSCRHRLIRGGSWRSEVEYLRSFARTRYSSDYRGSTIGFRVARDL